MSTTTKPKQQMLIKSTLYKTKKFLNKSFTNLKSFIPTKKPKTPISPSSNMIDSKSQELDDFYTSFSEKSNPNPNPNPNPNHVEVVMQKDGKISETEEIKKDGLQCSNGVDALKEETRKKKWSETKKEESSSVPADVLAQKMKDLEMMDLNDGDHAVDVEEVLHYYSRLTCPLYVDIVDQFFMDMYSDFHTPRPSRSLHCSMRKLTSDSTRSLGPLKL